MPESRKNLVGSLTGRSALTKLADTRRLNIARAQPDLIASLNPAALRPLQALSRPDLTRLPQPAARPTLPPRPAPAPRPAPPPATIPPAPQTDPFEALPFPNPGDRIRAEDFRALSAGIQQIGDAFLLIGAFFGRTFGETKQTLVQQNYQIQRVMTVFGTEIENLDDSTLDQRKVIQVLPLALGQPDVAVIVTELVDTRRVAPNLIGLSYAEAQEKLQALLGDLAGTTPAVTAPDIVGATLGEAQQTVGR